jgi:hypothetical protein
MSYPYSIISVPTSQSQTVLDSVLGLEIVYAN